jgi:RNA polymerase sigma-54 factor
MEEADRVDALATRILTEGIAELERGDRTGLARRLGQPGDRVDAALARLRRLDPAPGGLFAPPAAPILPEIEFLAEPEGSPAPATPFRLRVRLRHEDLPSLALDAVEPERVGSLLSTREGRSAARILTALALRRRNLLRLALLAAERQAPFLLGRKPCPAPLPLAEVADRVGLSLSTVWRIAGQTWARSPRGTLRLSSCFPAPLRTRRDRTAESLRAEIREGWERGESDAALARRMGLPARTVTYHRRAAGLPRVSKGS